MSAQPKTCYNSERDYRHDICMSEEPIYNLECLQSQLLYISLSEEIEEDLQRALGLMSLTLRRNLQALRQNLYSPNGAGI